MLTDSIDFIDSLPLVELYEPSERIDLCFAYYELLSLFPKLNDKKELQDQIIFEHPTHSASLEPL